MVLENDHLPDIVQDFLRHALTLQKLVQKATLEIVEDIRNMLYDRETFLVDELSRKNRYQIPQPKICYYYCRDVENGQVINIFSALILSLLEQLSGLKRPFYECLLKLLKTLSRNKPNLKTILSCRPEEILEQLTGTARIDLVSDDKRDRIIVEHTVERRLSYLTKDVRAFVIEKLSLGAQGSAIWTKMLTELIEIRGIRALGPMQLFLERMPLPKELSKLYDVLLSHCTSNGPENQELARIALKLLAVARRPLSILELAWAAALATAQQKITDVAALAKLVDHQIVLGLIHPFITRINFKDVKKRQIRLVHQSVKEFIEKDHASQKSRSQGPAIRTTTGQALIDEPIETLEALILDICIKYLLLEDIGHVKIFSEEQMAIDELPQEVDLFDDYKGPNDYDPHCTWEDWEEHMIHFDPIERCFGGFFVYASCHWLEHFSTIKAEPFPSIASIENVCHAGSTRLDNWIQQYCRPNCALKPRLDFDSRLYDPLSITSLYGSEAMLCHMLDESDFNEGKYFHQTAIRAADQILLWGDESRLKMLLMKDKTGDQLRNLEFFQVIMTQWSYRATRRAGWDPVLDLVDLVSDTMVEEYWANEMLCRAARVGCMPIIERLMIRAQHERKLSNELLQHQSIGEAVLGNHVDVVKYLLGQKGIEAHLRYRNWNGENQCSDFWSPTSRRVCTS
ncbi:hypothetical protein BDV97DRAFT_379781 [Delphinella strobiligena]|nr:hypothetical protein BDV97DRAFT_379781 [Delphinella strobiligena]